MKIQRNLVLAAILCLGISIGIAAEKAVQAQSAPPEYIVAEVKVNDPEAMKPYREGVEATVKQYGGRFVVRGNKIEGLEGKAPDGVIAILVFKSAADAHR